MDQVYADMGDNFANALAGRGTLTDALNTVQQSTVTFMKSRASVSLPSSPGTLWHTAMAALLVIGPEIRGDTVVASLHPTGMMEYLACSHGPKGGHEGATSTRKKG